MTVLGSKSFTTVVQMDWGEDLGLWGPFGLGYNPPSFTPFKHCVNLEKFCNFLKPQIPDLEIKLPCLSGYYEN